MSDPSAARAMARAAVADLGRSFPGLLAVGGIELGAALEQALFAFIRDRRRDERGGYLPARPGLRILHAAAMSLRADAPYRLGGVAVLIQVPIHAYLFQPIGDQLRHRGVAESTTIGVQPGLASSGFADVDLRWQLAPRWVPVLARHASAVARLPTKGRKAMADHPHPEFHDPARQALPRIALRAAQLESVLHRLRPSALVAFNEVGLWGRIAPAVARYHSIPSLDLPHAEASDPDAARDLAYDMVGVYGPRSADVMRRAGVAADRVHVVGPIRYDTLALRSQEPRHELSVRRVIYASQPVRASIPALSGAAKELALKAALAAADAVAPSELVVKPHPTEALKDLARLVRAIPTDARVAVRIDTDSDLHDLLFSATLLVTTSSQSVFDAAVAGVPAMMVHSVGGVPPVPYAAEGFAIEVTDSASARRAACALADPAQRAQALLRSRTALRGRVGELDGRASERAASLIESLILSPSIP
ncbi:MAG: hypothetical protein H0V49_05245 [Nocardioidaceae bacterium]|nr:hypothetical protein [Nocardioidaceae bacterium]